jgi:endoglucanase
MEVNMSPNKTTPKNSRRKLGKRQTELLRSLCDALSVSGDEQEVREIVLREVKPLCQQVEVDAMGNVLATRVGSAASKVQVMIAAHMDEVGFMLTQDDGDGLFGFSIVGGIDERQLVGKAVIVGREHIPGVIGAKAIHLTTPEERKTAVRLEQLRIDLGPDGGAKAKVGDRAGFATRYTEIGPSIRAKALDNRLGVANLIELLREAPENIDLLAAFTVQEEVGLRGARVAAYHLNPQIGIAVDSTPANDLPSYDEDGENTRYNTRLDHGPAIYLMDGATIADRRLAEWLMKTAEDEGIPYQIRQPNPGGTDAGAIHKTRAGVPSISVSVPQRYCHTAAGLIRRADWENALRLLSAALARLDSKTLTPSEA